MTEAVRRFARRYPRMATIWPRFSGPERWWIDLVRIGAAAEVLRHRMDAWYLARFRERPIATQQDLEMYQAAVAAEQETLWD